MARRRCKLHLDKYKIFIYAMQRIAEKLQNDL